jgi:hypothetical protein
MKVVLWVDNPPWPSANLRDAPLFEGDLANPWTIPHSLGAASWS